MDNFKEGICWKAASSSVALKVLHIQEIHYSARREQLILGAFYSHAMLSNIRASGRLHNSVVMRFLVDLTIHVVQESYSGMLHWVL